MYTESAYREAVMKKACEKCGHKNVHQNVLSVRLSNDAYEALEELRDRTGGFNLSQAVNYWLLKEVGDL